MTNDICIFKRIEKKYIINSKEKENLIAEISPYLIPDAYGKSTVCSLYLDTPNFLIIRNSISAKEYKEKLRLRCYGTPNRSDKVFLEIKKKHDGVVYKRRVAMPLEDAYKYMKNGETPEESQIMREIDYSMSFYGNPTPKAFIAYEREAYYVKDLPNLRLTFDSSVRYRTDDLLLESGSHGTQILPEECYILEIKTDGAMPVWLAKVLDKYKIFPKSFSKYGTAYRRITNKTYTPEGEKEYAVV